MFIDEDLTLKLLKRKVTNFFQMFGTNSPIFILIWKMEDFKFLDFDVFLWKHTK